MNMFFLFIIFSLPVKKRKRMFPFPSREENKNQDEAENLTQVSTVSTTREVHAPTSNPSNPSSNPSAFIHLINAADHELSCILFHNNSPLLPMFNQGVRYLRETGLERQLLYKWFGGWGKPNGPTPSRGHILTLSEMVTVFLMMLVVFFVAPIVLGGELTFKQYCTRFLRHGQREDET